MLIASRGKIFCAGGDLQSFSKAGDAMPGLLKEMTTYLHSAISRFARTNSPVIAAVGGTAAGAGFSLACAADLLVCRTADAAEGIAAFFARRPAKFTGA